MKTLEFNQEAVNQSINNYNIVNFAPEQINIIDNFAKIINSFISVNELALKGFISGVIKEWQKETGNNVSEIAGWIPEKRIKAVGTMFMKLYDVLINVLKYRKDSEKLDIAIKQAFEFYKKEFAFR